MELKTNRTVHCRGGGLKKKLKEKIKQFKLLIINVFTNIYVIVSDVCMIV